MSEDLRQSLSYPETSSVASGGTVVGCPKCGSATTTKISAYRILCLQCDYGFAPWDVKESGR